MGSVLTIAARAATVALGAASLLVVAAPAAQALSCAPATVWANTVDDLGGDHRLYRFSVDPTTGALTAESSVPIARVYGDIAVESEDGPVWGTDFLPADPNDNGFFPIDIATGAEGTRVAVAPPLVVTNGDAIQLNALSFRPDGKVYTAPGWSMNVFVVDLADGSWERPTLEIPQLEPGWDDNYPAGDFLTLESGEVLAVANAVEDGADADNTTVSYLVVFDFAANTVKTVGRFSHFVNGAAQSGDWVYFAGQFGTIYRLALADIPTADSPTTDLTTLVEPAFDLPGGKWFGIASPQDDGQCPPVAPAGAGAARLPDTGQEEDLLLLGLGGLALVGAGASALLLARERRTARRTAR